MFCFVNDLIFKLNRKVEKGERNAEMACNSKSKAFLKILQISRGKLKKDKRRALLSTVSKDLGLRGNCDQSAMSHGCTKTAVGVHGAK